MALSLICLIINFLTNKDIYLFAAIVVLIVTMTKPVILKPFALMWFNLSHFMGTVVSKVILTLIFFGLVVPTGILLILSGKDPMHMKKWKDGKGDSVMIVRDHIFTSKDLNNPF